MSTRHSFLVLFLLVAANGIFAAPSNLIQWCPTTEKAPTIDGVFSKGEWDDAVGVSGFIFGPTARVVNAQTIAYAMRTKDSLYLGFYMEEPHEGKFHAKITTRDGRLWWEHNIEIFIDVQHRSNKDYYHFIISGINTQYDAQGGAKSWDGQWISASKRGDGFESLEVEIPFKTLGRVPQDGEMWGINYSRLRQPVPDDKLLNVSYWADVQGNNHAVGKFGHIWFGPQKQLLERETLDALVIDTLGPLRVFLRDGYVEHSESSVTVRRKYVEESNRMKAELNKRLKRVTGDLKSKDGDRESSNKILKELSAQLSAKLVSPDNRSKQLFAWAHLLRTFNQSVKQIENMYWNQKVEELYKELGR